jgi:aspartate/methionine/tyrosine aminotransferase
MKLPSFRLERFFARYEFSVEHVLCASDCESMTVGDLLALEPGAEAWFSQCWLGYTESAGGPELREAIAGMYETLSPASVLVHSGAEEAIFLFMHAALEPGDHVVVQWPCYQSLFEVAKDLGCDLSLWRAKATDGWIPDVEQLAALLRPNTRAVIINTPHNPTGSQLSGPDFAALVSLAERRGCYLFSDEVYRESEYRAIDRLPAACDLSPKAVSLGVMSKTYGLPGLRIGWLATHDRALLGRVGQLKDYTTICNAAPSEFLATLALRHRDELIARTLGLLRTNLAHTDAFMERQADLFSWHPPAAGPIAFPGLRGQAAALGSDRVCERLALEAGVLLLPGSVYDVENHVRIGFGRRDLPVALAQLESALEGGVLD